MDRPLSLIRVKNYSNYLAYIEISPIPFNMNRKIKINTKKNFGYKHHSLHSGNRIGFKTLSLPDECSLSFNGSNCRYFTSHLRDYYYSVWIYNGERWLLHTYNQIGNWRRDINILGRW